MKKFYKGFNEDLTCRGFQYEEGKTYEENEASLCRKGFHACEDPLDCFCYYEPSSSQFREVLLDGISDQREDDSKVCAKKITIGARLNFSEMVKAAFEFRWSKTTLEPGSSATGENGAASATGWGGAASATGTRGAASATGWGGAASATGKEGIAAALGYKGRAKGAIGCWLILAEHDDWDGEVYPIKDIKTFKVDGKSILPDTWYALINGEPVKIEDL